ncbi:unnamed protein product [Enterobius vermicularis]|uniref:ABC1 domain-containing protein n=1 Tax=Enterobius vermicularis TaxID=51028 RepID=A0A0N4UV74_ENTVE|nr:unnamed protein product [Enterobius vermicularis]
MLVFFLNRLFNFSACYRDAQSGWDMLRKLCTLSLHFIPLLITYPLTCYSEKVSELWWKFAIWVLQSSGPTLIKLGQWASTRRDLFSKEFCDRLSVLHNRVSNVDWKRSRGKIDELFGGSHWESFIKNISSRPVGSGCIAEVHLREMNVDAFETNTGVKAGECGSRGNVDIAIKVSYYCNKRIAIDLAILKAAAYVLESFIPGFFYVNPLSSLNQFEIVLQRQVDLRNEAKALQRFAKNFDPERTHVKFPKVFCYSKDVIIESFEDGMPVNKLVTGDDKELSHQNSAVKRRIALLGARTILKMIFVDNFIHGDLHPGNILIRFDGNGKKMGGIHRSPTKFKWGSRPRIRFTNDTEYEDEPTLVILDTGIAIEETPQNLRNLSAVFVAIVEKRGYDVGKLLIEHAPRSDCTKPEEFCREVERIVNVARSNSSLRKLNISQLLNELFSIVSSYRVGLETSFTTIILAVLVLEGLGRSLDPDLDLFKCAYPFLVRGVLC